MGDLSASSQSSSLRALHAFARRHGIEDEVVVAVFEREFKRLDDRARVHRYVPLLAEKHTREVLIAIPRPG
ncbi:MAG: DUF3562 domain-containing protein [Betaproteobacteria bacterium]|nr:DUF3562 domain-containing protein [Betaproteobacteria bacterium]MBV9360400.1 DUF3562 domain-containing protein [Betaproteobacteria bacterium]